MVPGRELEGRPFGFSGFIKFKIDDCGLKFMLEFFHEGIVVFY